MQELPYSSGAIIRFQVREDSPNKARSQSRSVDKVEEFVAFACSKSQNNIWKSQIGMNHAVVIPHNHARLLLDTQGTKHDGQTYYYVWTMKDRH